MNDRIKGLNSPSPWNMRIWDETKRQWLCDGEDDVLPYCGFNIRGGEVTAMQSMDWVYRQFEHGRKLIWERSTGFLTGIHDITALGRKKTRQDLSWNRCSSSPNLSFAIWLKTRMLPYSSANSLLASLLENGKKLRG